MQTCEPYLFAQIDCIRPRVIVALGSFAARTLLRDDRTSITKVQGQGVRLSGRAAHPHVPPGVPPAESGSQAGGLGGHEARPIPVARGLSRMARHVSVAVPVPFLPALTYRVPR